MGREKKAGKRVRDGEWEDGGRRRDGWRGLWGTSGIVMVGE
jgi:hypothetical protein